MFSSVLKLSPEQSSHTFFWLNALYNFFMFTGTCLEEGLFLNSDQLCFESEYLVERTASFRVWTVQFLNIRWVSVCTDEILGK